MTNDGLALLAAQEGVRYRPYDDVTGRELRPGDILRGKLTIGVGHNLTANGISVRICNALLADDVLEIENRLAELEWYSSLDLIRRDVVINMAFNIGPAGLLDFRAMIAAIERQDYEAAAVAMLDSRWARQVPSRAQRLAAIMRSGRV